MSSSNAYHLIGVRTFAPANRAMLGALMSDLEAAASRFQEYIADAETYYRALNRLQRPQCQDDARAQLEAEVERLRPIVERQPTLPLSIQSCMSQHGLLMLKTNESLLSKKDVLAELRELYRDASEELNETPLQEPAAPSAPIEGERHQAIPLGSLDERAVIELKHNPAAIYGQLDAAVDASGDKMPEARIETAPVVDSSEVKAKPPDVQVSPFFLVPNNPEPWEVPLPGGKRISLGSKPLRIGDMALLLPAMVSLLAKSHDSPTEVNQRVTARTIGLLWSDSGFHRFREWCNVEFGSEPTEELVEKLKSRSSQELKVPVDKIGLMPVAEVMRLVDEHFAVPPVSEKVTPETPNGEPAAMVASGSMTPDVPEGKAAAVAPSGSVTPQAVAEPSDFVTLDQCAALVNRDKRTLERYKRAMPRPKVLGGGGKPHEYPYSEMKPWLEKTFGRILPQTYPGKTTG